MFPLTETEADIINYLYKHMDRSPYAAEIAKDLKISKATMYRNLDSLEMKGIVEKELKGRMKFYKLSGRWKEVAEAAKLVTETDEAPLLSIFHMKIRSLMNRELEILEQIGKEEIVSTKLNRQIVQSRQEESNLDKEFERRKTDIQREIGLVVEIPRIAAFRGLKSFEDLVTRVSYEEQQDFMEDVESLLKKISSLMETRDRMKLVIKGLEKLREKGLIDENKYKARKSEYDRKLRIIEDFLENVKDLL